MRLKLLTLLLLISFSSVVYADKRHSRDWIIRGKQAMELKDFHQALFYFSRAIEENPKAVKAYLHRAKVYVIFSRLEDARDDYNRAASLSREQATPNTKKVFEDPEKKEDPADSEGIN